MRQTGEGVWGDSWSQVERSGDVCGRGSGVGVEGDSCCSGDKVWIAGYDYDDDGGVSGAEYISQARRAGGDAVLPRLVQGGGGGLDAVWLVMAGDK